MRLARSSQESASCARLTEHGARSSSFRRNTAALRSINHYSARLRQRQRPSDWMSPIVIWTRRARVAIELAKLARLTVSELNIRVLESGTGEHSLWRGRSPCAMALFQISKAPISFRQVYKEAVYLLTRRQAAPARRRRAQSQLPRRVALRNRPLARRQAEAHGVSILPAPAARLVMRGQAVASMRTAAPRSRRKTDMTAQRRTISREVTALAGTRGLWRRPLRWQRVPSRIRIFAQLKALKRAYRPGDSAGLAAGRRLQRQPVSLG
jgi:hypothetical protein